MNRDDYFDNLKCGLIFLVVAGHFLLPLEQTRLVKTGIYLIYAFHMPCFVLVSGYFAKNVYRDGSFRTDRWFQIIWLYILFKILAHVTEHLAAGTPVSLYVDFFKESGAPWYLMAMAWWYLTLPVIAHLKPSAVIAASMLLSVFAGYQYSIGSVLVMSRTFAFAPFFYVGYYLTPEHRTAFRHSRSRLAILAGAAAVAVIIIAGADSFLAPYLEIVYGMGYSRLPDSLYACGGLIRLAWYGVAAILSAGFMLAIPKKKTWASAIGRNSLQIYILHRLLRDLMQHWGFYNHVNAHEKLQVLAVVALAAIVTLVLSNGYLARVFDRIRRLPDSWVARRNNGTRQSGT